MALSRAEPLLNRVDVPPPQSSHLRTDRNGEQRSPGAKGVRLLDEFQPALERRHQVGPLRQHKINGRLTALQCRHRLMPCARPHVGVVRQDLADEPRQALWNLDVGDVEATAEVDERKLANEVVLLVLRLDEQGSRDTE